MSQLPSHNHAASGVSSAGTTTTPGATALWSTSSRTDGIYQNAAPDVEMFALGDTGGDQAHENRSPILTLNYCIALQGIYPPRN